MSDTDLETRIAEMERRILRLEGRVEAHRIALASTAAFLRDTPTSDVQIALARSLENIAMAHTPLPDEHHTGGFHDELREISGYLDADLAAN
ncbi:MULTISPECIES: hypothetical protein [Phaeobacter]|uniref:hypothetical protein n=1 Tax=Phaeobacter TaxID=302485 RepID=UPI00058BE42A|nr:MULTISPECIES: hypothetical protein [Phaeobacter]AUQ89374.1 hypothetical protein PhaeoP24_00728 [Phaeobacter inhibens]KII12602.1 hypothetical protein OO25_17120 [Phaeobacter sp. S60]